ncbi:hypothetical protein P691DRAFT_781960 [Macrolepiota fuliginosa MF-IS2]|uniref:Uncharacterized protein n=1 Tax=Macrolepiota fuliginosa MF-IS2 TaxID=1400762 RepID=A0A9P5XB26_9AGAR|nr:hypothetical protein P691DRAFT_781960 [Macrolepiota fuliginosa MF-IS2]
MDFYQLMIISTELEHGVCVLGMLSSHWENSPITRLEVWLDRTGLGLVFLPRALSARWSGLDRAGTFRKGALETFKARPSPSKADIAVEIVRRLRMETDANALLALVTPNRRQTGPNEDVNVPEEDMNIPSHAYPDLHSPFHKDPAKTLDIGP